MQSPIVTQSAWLISLKERQEKVDGDVGKVEDVESLAVVSGNEEEVKEGVEEEFEEEVCESRLLCSSPSPQLARQVHSENNSVKHQFLPAF